MRTKNSAYALDNSVLHEPFSIEPLPQTEGHINTVDIEFEHRPLDVFVRILVLIGIVLFVIYRMVGGMVADVITQCRGMDDPAASVKVVRVNLGSPCNMHVLERYTRVLPLGHDGRLKDDGDARFGSEIVANSTSDRGYAIDSQHCRVM